MWFFGISLSPIGWLIAFIIALILVFTPFIVIGAIAEQLPEPFSTLVFIVGSYIVTPALVSYLYSTKMNRTGRGSAIFWIYCGFFACLFVATVSQLFSKELSLETVLGPIVTGTVTFLMVTFAYKTKSVHEKDMKSYHAAQYEDDIRKHAEAILLAEEMKKERGKS